MCRHCGMLFGRFADRSGGLIHTVRGAGPTLRRAGILSVGVAGLDFAIAIAYQEFFVLGS
jgi:hypothetical protein